MSSAPVDVYPDPVVATPIPSAAIADAFTAVEFGATYTGGNGTPTVSWEGLPPGCGSYALNFTCVPTVPGTYLVRADLVDGNGEPAASPGARFTVAPALSESISGPTGAVAAGVPTGFTATPVGGVGPYRYAWTFGDGGTGSGALVSHTFTLPGTYVVGLTTTDAGNGSVSRSMVVTVAAPSPPSPSLIGLWASLLVGGLAVGAAALLVRRRRRRRSVRPGTRRPSKRPRRGAPPVAVRYTLPFLNDDSWGPPVPGTAGRPPSSGPESRPSDPRSRP